LQKNRQTERLQTDTVLDTGTTTCRDHSQHQNIACHAHFVAWQVKKVDDYVAFKTAARQKREWRYSGKVSKTSSTAEV